MKCIITGGAGFIGSNLADKLVELGHKVIVIDNLSTGRKQNLKNEIKRIENSNSFNKKKYKNICLNFSSI